MNRHLRALTIVAGIAILVGVAVFVSLKSREDVAAESDTASSPIQVNSVFADFEAKTLEGKGIRLSQFHGKLVVVNFWASWCGPCVEEMPSLIKLVKAFPQDLELIAISGDSTREDIESFLKSFPELKTMANIHLVWDETKALSQKYQIYRLPESVLVDQQQRAIKKVAGSINWAADDAFQYVRQLVAAGGKSSDGAEATGPNGVQPNSKTSKSDK